MRIFRRTALLCVVVVTVAGAVVGCGAQVPDVKGKTVAQAEQALAKSRFKLGKVTYDERTEGAPGAIVSQDPAAGGRGSGGAVNVVVAGAAPVSVPDVRGLPLDMAERGLQGAGFVLGPMRQVYSETALAGEVTSQTPAPGKQAPKGSSVVVVVSNGPKPPEGKPVRVPDVVSTIRNHTFENSYQDDAKAAVAELKQLVSDELEVVGLRGEVKLQAIMQTDRQEPKAGSMVPRGTLVRVYVGVGD